MRPFQTNASRTRPALGRVVCGRRTGGLKDAELQMGPTSGTLSPLQAGLWDGASASVLATTRIRVWYAHSRVTGARSVPTRQCKLADPSQPGKGETCGERS